MIVDRLSFTEQDVLVAALEDRPGSARSLMRLSPDLMSKTQNLLMFMSLESAPQRELTQFAVARLRLSREAESLIIR